MPAPVYRAFFLCDNDSDLSKLLLWLWKTAPCLSLLTGVFFVHNHSTRYVQLFASRPFEAVTEEEINVKHHLGGKLQSATTAGLDGTPFDVLLDELK